MLCKIKRMYPKVHPLFLIADFECLDFERSETEGFARKLRFNLFKHICDFNFLCTVKEFNAAVGVSALCFVKSCNESFFVVFARLYCFNDDVILFGNNKRNSFKITLAGNNGNVKFICGSDNV